MVRPSSPARLVPQAHSAGTNVLGHPQHLYNGKKKSRVENSPTRSDWQIEFRAFVLHHLRRAFENPRFATQVTLAVPKNTKRVISDVKRLSRLNLKRPRGRFCSDSDQNPAEFLFGIRTESRSDPNQAGACWPRAFGMASALAQPPTGELVLQHNPPQIKQRA